MKTPLSQIIWPDARGWIGIGVFSLTIILLLMMRDKALREDEFFQTIATVIISNGLMAVVAWAYSATKGGGERGDAVAKVAQTLATNATQATPPSPPVPPATPSEDLPEYAR